MCCGASCAGQPGTASCLTSPSRFCSKSVRVVAEQLQAVYPEVLRSIDYITKVVLSEEQTFTATLESGLKILQEEMEKLKTRGGVELPGDTVFKLYDTYGFPVDLTADIAREQGMMIDQEGFEAAMQEQRTRARQAWKGSGEESIGAIYKKLVQDGIKVEFTGYEQPAWRMHASPHILKNGELVQIRSRRR